MKQPLPIVEPELSVRCTCGCERRVHRNAYVKVVTNYPVQNKEYVKYDNGCNECTCEEFWGAGWMS